MRNVVHCKKRKYDVYIGRPGKWGNPFVIGKDGTREEVVDKYAAWIKTQPALLAAIPSLKGKRLGCWCAPALCHGNVLSTLANGGEWGTPVQKILDEVISETPFTLAEIKSHRRRHELVVVRFLIYYLLLRFTRLKTGQICAMFGRDHTAIYSGVKTFKDWIEVDIEIKFLAHRWVQFFSAN